MPAQPTGSQTLTSSSKFTWEITNFTQLNEETEYYYSSPFTVGIYSWKVVVYPKGNNSPGYLSLYLEVADSENLPNGWTTSVDYSLTVVNQSTPNSSLKRKIRSRIFCASSFIWGYQKMVTLVKVHNDGFLVNDTLIIKVGLVSADAIVAEKQVVTSPELLDSYFSSLEEYISRVNDVPVCCSRSPSDARCPTLEEVQDAKSSLRECLVDLVTLNMKDRLAEALLTLSRAKVGLSTSLASSVRAFWNRFEEITSDFLSFEEINSELELQKLLKDQMFSKMKKCHEQHITLKKLSKQIAEEEEEYERKMGEIRKRKEKLESDWEVLLVESQEAKSKYEGHEKKAKDAEDKKRIAEERMSTTACSSLKQEFA
ncbi:hypothetical protein MLD38_035103 [Melastoma candidum]|uniref:Uncharacterized protein n=1 Tax=Melastoma candidum TaxID=119954 RepID=A0ACB9MCH7_9MYRT|nr:hypothetical protein MLD38_035103 [Melastoma candidum]